MKFRFLSIAMIICLVVCTSLMAQPPGDRGFRGGRRGGPQGMRGQRGFNPMMLLSIEAVQNEIELLEEQQDEIRSLADKMRGGRGQRGERGDRPNFAEMTDDERVEFREARRKEAEERAESLRKELSAILLDDQMDRLQEIYVQVAGSQAITDPVIAKELGLTEDQLSEIESTRRELQRSMRGQMRDAFEGGDRAALREKMQEMRKDMDTKVLAVLTEDQQEQFASMEGAPFEMPEGALFGRRGRRGGFGGGGADGDRPQRPRRPQRRQRPE